MATNKYTANCKECGEIILPGKGILSSEWYNQADDSAWVVRHADKSICQRVKSAAAAEQSASAAIERGIAWIKAHGVKSAAQDGAQVIWDGRRGYNQTGWLLSRTGNTLYITSRANLDGHDMGETYAYTASADNIDDRLWAMELA